MAPGVGRVDCRHLRPAAPQGCHESGAGVLERARPVAKQLTTAKAIVVGDLNTAVAQCDSTSGLPLPASKELQRLTDDGWRDTYREIHGDRLEYSYWHSGDAYRIDHAMLSPAAPRARNAEYLRTGRISIGEMVYRSPGARRIRSRGPALRHLTVSRQVP